MNKPFDIQRYIKEGWELFSANAVNLVVATLLFVVVHFAANFIPFMGFVIDGPMKGGMFYVVMDIMASKPFEVSRIFYGFKKTVPLVMVGILTGAFILLCSIPSIIMGMIIVLWYILPYILAITGDMGPFTHLLDGLSKIVPLAPPGILIPIFIVIGAILLILPCLLVAGWYLFAYIFVIDEEMDFWSAMEASRKIGFDNHVMVAVTVIVLALINLVMGVLGFGVGLLVSIPLSFCVIAKAYEDQHGFRSLIDNDINNAMIYQKKPGKKPKILFAPLHYICRSQ